MRIEWARHRPSSISGCVLCETWNSLPHGARYTSPTTVTDTAEALDLGFWLASHLGVSADNPPALCETHLGLLQDLDERASEKLAESRRADTMKPQPSVGFLIESVPRIQRRELLTMVQTLVDQAAPNSNPPAEDKIPCGVCGEMVGRGEVHSCAVDEDELPP